MIFIIGKRKFRIRIPKINTTKIKEVFKVDEERQEMAEFLLSMVGDLILAYLKTNPFVSDEEYMKNLCNNWVDETEQRTGEETNVL